MYARSRMSGLSHSDVALLRTVYRSCCASSHVAGLWDVLRKGLTTAVMIWGWTRQAMIRSCKASP